MSTHRSGTLFLVLLVLVILLAGSLSQRHFLRFDWTRAETHTLGDASLTLLAQLDHPVRITAWTGKNELKRPITDLVDRYRRHSAHVTLEFVDPDREPARARAAGVRFEGELTLEVGDARENLSEPTEAALTGALLRLTRPGARTLYFLTGHGERAPDQAGDDHLGMLARRLTERGFGVKSLHLAETGKLPDDIGLLVIAAARTEPLKGELRLIERYLEQGGALLWLAEPGTPRLQALADRLDLEFIPGTVVSPESSLLTGAPPTLLALGEYGTHAAVRDFALSTLWPEAVALDAGESSGESPGEPAGASSGKPGEWNHQTLLETRATTWAETGSQPDRPTFTKGRDTRGPLTLALAYTRSIEDREQRLAVVGDSDFLSNRYLGLAGNLDFGLSLIHWASGDDSGVELPARIAPDLKLDLTPVTARLLTLFFAVVLPLAFALAGFMIGWRRRGR